jgi:polysaccharide biosynthesis protein PslL
MELTGDRTNKPRIEWIDSCKGIGMIAVVLGHGVTATITYVYFFHMPLFFFLSGYLYRPKLKHLDFLRRKALHLLIPYLSFLCLLSFPVYLYDAFQLARTVDLSLIDEIKTFTFKLVYGGALLSNWLGTFWFVTCLFITQQIYQILYTKISSKTSLILILVGAYCVAMFEYWWLPKLLLPWSLDAVPMALAFYGFGHLAARQEIDMSRFSKLAICIIFGVTLLNYWSKLDLTFLMKYHDYGVVIINFLLAVAGIILSIHLAKIFSRDRFANKVLSEIGSASMVILYVHQLVLLILTRSNAIASEVLRTIIALLIPYLLYKFIAKFQLLRQLFLGEWSNRKSPVSSP